MLSKSPWNKSTPSSWCFLSHFEKKKKTRFDDRGCHLKFCFEIHLNSMGANNPPMGLAFDRRGNQEKGEQTWGELYSTPQNKEPKEGEGRTRPLIYLFAPLLFQALEKKAKKSAKGRERLSWENYHAQREELVGGNDHEMNWYGCFWGEKRS